MNRLALLACLLLVPALSAQTPLQLVVVESVDLAKGQLTSTQLVSVAERVAEKRQKLVNGKVETEIVAVTVTRVVPSQSTRSLRDYSAVNPKGTPIAEADLATLLRPGVAVVFADQPLPPSENLLSLLNPRAVIFVRNPPALKPE